mmetsp:Transcript_25798/g.36165  ORF Transcript_25798/g.36165 Transcript_25798/m.36165 type:complete len:93 (+) Transcript_25798:1394-1672(+)
MKWAYNSQHSASLLHKSSIVVETFCKRITPNEAVNAKHSSSKSMNDVNTCWIGATLVSKAPCNIYTHLEHQGRSYYYPFSGLVNTMVPGWLT